MPANIHHNLLGSAVYHALSLNERVERVERASAQPSSSRGINFDTTLAEKQLNRWKNQRPFANAELFTQRLVAEGLSEARFAQALGQTSEMLGHVLAESPEWIHPLTQCIPATHFPNSVDATDIDLSQSEGLVDVVGPLVQAAREQLRHGLADLLRNFPHAPFSDVNAIEKMLYASLHENLRRMLTKTMVLEMNVARIENLLKGEMPGQRFWSFVARLHDHSTVRALIEEYPVLFRQLAAKIESWVQVSLEMMQRLCADWTPLVAQFCNAQPPGLITKIRSGSGTTRQGGRSVTIITLQSGFKIIYKPKSLAVDVHFQNLLSWLNDRGVCLQFRVLQMLDRGSYGWVEWVSAQACTSQQAVARFFRRQGGYLALLYLLDATDFHQDNLIAAGEHPILIDLEALFHPRLDNDDDDIDNADKEPAAKTSLRQMLERVMSHSVLNTRLLPEPVVTDDESDGYDTSGLTGRDNQLTPYTVSAWDNLWTDEMKLVRKRVHTSGGQNLPTLKDAPVDALAYRQKIVEGFESTYKLLLHHRAELLDGDGPLTQFAHDEVRVMLHSNSTYDRLLNDSLHPDLLRDALDRDRHFDRLWIAAEHEPRFARIIIHEQQDLRAGDMPLFTTRPGSQHLFSSAGVPIENFFKQSGLALARTRIQHMNASDLARQTWFIRASLATLVKGAHQAGLSQAAPSAKPTREPAHKHVLAHVYQIGDRLAQLAFQLFGEAGWLGVSLTDDQHWSVGPLQADLYNGLPGVALFLAHLGAISHEQRFTKLAHAVAAPLRGAAHDLEEPLPGIGAFSGAGGLIYTFAHLGALWDDNDWIKDAEAWVARLPEFIDRDDTLNILDGTAGCLGSLLALHKVAPTDTTLAMAIRCGRHLLDQLQPRLAEETTPSHARTRIGFARGLSGIAWALMELAAVTDEREFADEALAALAYERNLLRAIHKNNLDSRLATWRDGAAGVGLVRLRCLQHTDALGIDQDVQVAIRDDIETCLSLVQAHGFGSNHSLAHGDMGSLEFLLQAVASLGVAQPPTVRFQFQAMQRATQFVDSIRRDGWISAVPMGLETPGLMTGLAGTGLGLLRLIEPAHVPCVLTLDPPTEKREGR